MTLFSHQELAKTTMKEQLSSRLNVSWEWRKTGETKYRIQVLVYNDKSNMRLNVSLILKTHGIRLTSVGADCRSKGEAKV